MHRKSHNALQEVNVQLMYLNRYRIFMKHILTGLDGIWIRFFFFTDIRYIVLMLILQCIVGQTEHANGAWGFFCISHAKQEEEMKDRFALCIVHRPGKWQISKKLPEGKWKPHGNIFP